MGFCREQYGYLVLKMGNAGKGTSFRISIKCKEFLILEKSYNKSKVNMYVANKEKFPGK